MKILVGIAALLLSSVSQAAYIQCTPGQADTVVNAIGTSATFTCNAGAGLSAGSGDDNVLGDGYTITSVNLRLSGTFQDNNAVNGQTYSVVYTGVEGSSQFAVPAISCTASAAGDSNNQALGSCVSTSASAAVAGSPDALSSFTVTVSGAAGSNPLPFNGSSSVFYQVVATAAQVSEPASLGLIAAAFAGMAMVRRRRAK